ncbi:hypothetical protein ACG7TL_007133 [Trametes sanguinea]
MDMSEFGLRGPRSSVFYTYDTGKGTPFPPGTRGFFYWKSFRGFHPMSGELRFRITPDARRESFTQGRDLLGPDDFPWRIPALTILSVWPPLMEQLKGEGYLSEFDIRPFKRELKRFDWGFPPKMGDPVMTFGPAGITLAPFVFNFATLLPSQACNVTGCLAAPCRRQAPSAFRRLSSQQAPSELPMQEDKPTEESLSQESIVAGLLESLRRLTLTSPGTPDEYGALPPFPNLHPDRLTPNDFVDLSGRFFHVDKPAPPTSPPRRSMLHYARDDQGKRLPFPQDTRGFLYYFRRENNVPVGGELRFRLTDGPSPESFAAGKDLPTPDGFPWRAHALFILRYCDRLAEHLVEEGHITRDGADRFKRLTRLQTWRKSTLEEPVLEPGRWPKFVYDFALRKPKSAWLVTSNSFYRIGVDVFVPKQGVLVPKAGSAVLRITRIKKNLPGDGAYYMARCYEILKPLVYPAPVEGSEDVLQGPDDDRSEIHQQLSQDLPLLEIMPERALKVNGKLLTWRLRGLNYGKVFTHDPPEK